MAKSVLSMSDKELLELQMSIVLYKSYREDYFLDLSDEQAGKLIKCILHYARFNDIPEGLDTLTYHLFKRIKSDIDTSNESWILKTKRNALGGKKHTGNQYTRLKEERKKLESDIKKMEHTSNSFQKMEDTSNSFQKMEPNGTYGSNNKNNNNHNNNTLENFSSPTQNSLQDNSDFNDFPEDEESNEIEERSDDYYSLSASLPNDDDIPF